MEVPMGRQASVPFWELMPAQGVQERESLFDRWKRDVWVLDFFQETFLNGGSAGKYYALELGLDRAGSWDWTVFYAGRLMFMTNRSLVCCLG